MAHSTKHPPAAEQITQDLSWSAQKSKEDVLTFSLLEALNYEFLGTGALLTPELHHDRRLKQDFVLTLPSGQEYTLEAKFEDYPDSLFPEVAQLVLRPGNVRLIEPGWIYKTTAHYLVYISTKSGIGTLIPRERALRLQEFMVQDVLLRSGHYEIPVMLNAALNASTTGAAIAMPRAGIGLGLLRSNILSAYRAHYGEEGLYQFDLSDSLRALKLHLTGERPIPNGPLATAALRTWAEKTLMTQPHGITKGLVSLEELPGRLAADMAGGAGALSCKPIVPICYGFFLNAIAARMSSGQHWLFQHVEGTYRAAGGEIIDVKVPIDSKVKPQLDGIMKSRPRVQARTLIDLKLLGLPVENLAAMSLAYLQKVNGLLRTPPWSTPI